MRKKKIEKTRPEIMVEVLTTLADWRSKYIDLYEDAKWKALHDHQEMIKKSVDSLFQDCAREKILLPEDLIVIRRTIEKWFPEESKVVRWYHQDLIDEIIEFARREKERGKS
jgi:hypothetical protein|nr:MAG TPA: hypothetical protein [Caudoviricetes sp.]